KITIEPCDKYKYYVKDAGEYSIFRVNENNEKEYYSVFTDTWMESEAELDDEYRIIEKKLRLIIDTRNPCYGFKIDSEGLTDITKAYLMAMDDCPIDLDDFVTVKDDVNRSISIYCNDEVKLKDFRKGVVF